MRPALPGSPRRCPGKRWKHSLTHSTGSGPPNPAWLGISDGKPAPARPFAERQTVRDQDGRHTYRDRFGYSKYRMTWGDWLEAALALVVAGGGWWIRKGLKDLEAGLAALRTDLTKRIDGLEKSNNESQAVLMVELIKRIDDLEKSSNESQAALKAALIKRIDSLEKSGNESRAALKTDLTKRIDGLEKSNNESRAALKAALIKRIDE